MTDEELLEHIRDDLADAMDKRFFEIFLQMTKPNPLEEGLKCFTRRL